MNLVSAPPSSLPIVDDVVGNRGYDRFSSISRASTETTSMLPNNLTTNEVKDSAGVEIEFNRIRSSDREVEFQKVGELPGTPHRISVKHQETGSGVTRRRRSVLRADLTLAGSVDTTKTVTVSAYLVVDIPIGNMSSYVHAKTVLANILSLTATTGAATTVLFDGTGHGAVALVNGEL